MISLTNKALSLAVMVVAALVFLIQGQTARRISLSRSMELPPSIYVPKASKIKPFLLGHEAFVADLAWIRVLGLVGEQLMARRKFDFTYEIIDFASDLDPRFDRLFIWSGASLMYGGGRIDKRSIRQSNAILKKAWDFAQSDVRGWRHDRDYWMIPQMLGFNHAVELGDKATGAKYIEAAARIPGAPNMLKTYASTLYSRSGDDARSVEVLEDLLAVEMLTAQLGRVRNHQTQQNVEEKLQGLYTRLYGSDEAKRRLAKVQGEWRSLVRGWFGEMPYVHFALYVLLSREQEMGADDHLQEFFPLLWGSGQPTMP